MVGFSSSSSSSFSKAEGIIGDGCIVVVKQAMKKDHKKINILVKVAHVL